MKRYWIEYKAERPTCPMTYWVHREADGKPWYAAKVFDPPRQKSVPGHGYPVFHVEIDDLVFTFTSLAELQVCIETLSRKLLPTTKELSLERDSGMGPNSHWLSRLPGEAKLWRYREKAVRYLRKAAKAFQSEFI